MGQFTTFLYVFKGLIILGLFWGYFRAIWGSLGIIGPWKMVVLCVGPPILVLRELVRVRRARENGGFVCWAFIWYFF